MPSESKGTVLDTVLAHADAIRDAIAPLGATRIAVFGSVARGEERSDSDIDLLVDLAPDTGLFALLRMRSLAEGLLGRRVDIVPRDGLKPGIAETMLRESITL